MWTVKLVVRSNAAPSVSGLLVTETGLRAGEDRIV